LELGLLSLAKTANPEHMKTNAELDFAIYEKDMGFLKKFQQIEDYGEHSRFPVFARKRSLWQNLFTLIYSPFIQFI